MEAAFATYTPCFLMSGSTSEQTHRLKALASDILLRMLRLYRSGSLINIACLSLSSMGDSQSPMDQTDKNAAFYQ